tara:strand:+ start:122 stop:718 length:597 start_codon:yes stop_codon:yes gene_type:complete
MPLLITEPMVGDINTISIPTDAIFTVSLLIVFSLIGYFLDKIVSNDTNQFAQKKVAASNLELVKEELEDLLTLEGTTLDQKNEEKPRRRIKKLNFLPTAKLLGLGGLAVVGMGGASLLGFQNMQKSYEGVSNSQANVNLENQSTKNHLSVIDLKSFNKTQKNVKQISYIDSFLSTIKSSNHNHFYQIKEKQVKNIFSF